MSTYLVEFGMDCIEIDEGVYQFLMNGIMGNNDGWAHIYDVGKEEYDINLQAIKYIHKKPTE